MATSINGRDGQNCKIKIKKAELREINNSKWNSD